MMSWMPVRPHLSIRGIAALAALLVVAAAVPCAAQGGLRGQFTAQAQALEAELDRYFDAREAEDAALAELAQLNRALDDAMADPQSGLPDFERLDGEIAEARGRALTHSRKSAELRRGMYASMRQLAELARRLERSGVELSGGVDGSWQIESQPNDVWGFLEISQEGSLISGSYRLSNGNRGSLRGTYTGGRLEFELVDSRRGLVADARGELDQNDGEIRGTWQRRELASGEPTAGEWTARRVD